jgi:hypothetical protein
MDEVVSNLILEQQQRMAGDVPQADEDRPSMQENVVLRVEGINPLCSVNASLERDC